MTTENDKARAAAWKGFKPDVSPLPEQKSLQEQLDDNTEQLNALEEKRKELQLEIAKKEALEKILDGEIDLTAEQEKDLHVDCYSREELDEVEEKAGVSEEEAWGYLREFGGHTAACLSGALAASQELHPLCTCGWNHVATELEKA